MGAIMLIFVFVNGPITMALPFPTLAACEAEQSGVMQKLADAGAVYAAAACVMLTKVRGT